MDVILDENLHPAVIEVYGDVLTTRIYTEFVSDMYKYTQPYGMTFMYRKSGNYILIFSQRKRAYVSNESSCSTLRCLTLSQRVG